MSDIVKKKSMDLSISPLDKFNQIDGLSGVEQEDIQLPSLYVVQKGAKAGSTNLIGGGVAKEGTLYSSGEMKEYDHVDVVIVSAVKNKKTDDKTGDIYSQWRIVMFPVDNPQSPFVLYCKKTADWSGWRPFFNNLPSLKIKGLYELVVRITSRQDSNKAGLQYYVPEFVVIDKISDELLEYAKKAGAKLSQLRNDDDTDDISEVLKKDENFDEEIDNVSSEELPFN